MIEQDPPQQFGRNTIIPKNKTFIKWNDVSNYQRKIDQLNIFLEKEEKIRRQQTYWAYLDKYQQAQHLESQQKRLSEPEQSQEKMIEEIESKQREINNLRNRENIR